MKRSAFVATALLAAGGPAWAGSNRVWVSGHGVDHAGCGAPTAPCRSLQYAHDSAVNAGGEIDILDPAGYGAVTITKALSIVNDGVGTAGVQASSGVAITVSTGPTDAVLLRGLNIDGLNGSATTGVLFTSGARLIVDHCIARHFQDFGIRVMQTSGASDFGVYDSLLSDNLVGFDLQSSTGSPTVAGVLDRVIANGNSTGGIAVTSTAAGASAKVTISNNDASDNGDYGIATEADSGSVIVEINNSTMENNFSRGLWTIADARTHLARSVLDANGQFGIDNEATGSGVTYSSLDNHVEENGSAPVNGPTLTTDVLQ